MTGSNFTIAKPEGLDFAIQMLQDFLYRNLDWENCQLNGRVDKIPNPESDKGFKPFAYFTENDYRNVERDDIYNGNIFFVADDTISSDNGFSFSCNVSIVFMVDVVRLYPDYIGRASTLAQKDAVKAIQDQSAFTITSIGLGVDEALKDFDNEDVKFTDMHPNHVFCINGTLRFQITC